MGNCSSSAPEKNEPHEASSKEADQNETTSPATADATAEVAALKIENARLKTKNAELAAERAARDTVNSKDVQIVLEGAHRPEQGGASRARQAQEAKPEEWSAAKWLAEFDLPGLLARHLLQSLGAEAEVTPKAALAFFKGLRSKQKQEIRHLLEQGALLDDLAEVLLTRAKELSRGAANSVAALSKKFSDEGGAFELTFGDRAKFYGGIGAVVGPPKVKVREAMEDEHCKSEDSEIPFTATNYKIRTTSKQEWLFTTAPDTLTQVPKEDIGGHVASFVPRKPRPLSYFDATLAKLNDKLKARKISPLGIDELIGLRQYSGPMYMKYNTVLRFCVSAQPSPDEDSPLFALCRSNRYTTTLHVINSGVVKLGKIAEVGTVYRGVKGAVLPAAFYTPDEDGVLGGIENAFMSTSTDRQVALEYAGAEGAEGKPGIVLEIDQGAIDRGADISPLSQYEHEKEVLWPPLTSLQVTSTHIIGSVLLVRLRPNINHANLPIEQTVSKRRTLVREMCESMASELRGEVHSDKWQELCALQRGGGSPPAGEVAEAQLQQRLSAIQESEPAWYNEDAQLSEALTMAVDVKTAVSLWPAGLALLQQRGGQASLASLFEARKVSIKAARDEKPIGPEAAYGACALLALSAPLLELRLPGNRLGLSGAKTLAHVLRSNGTLHTLVLDGSQLASNVGTEGAVHICSVLETNSSLTSLSLADNRLDGKDVAFKSALKAALRASTSLQELDLRFNRSLGWAGADAVLGATAPLRRLNLLNTDVGADKARRLAALDLETLCGLQAGAVAFDAPNKALDSGDAILLAADLRRSASLASVDISRNQIGDEAADALAEAIWASPALASLNVSGNAFSTEGLAKLRKAAASKPGLEPGLVLHSV